MAHLDEEQHYERLDMDADYEGGEFIGGEFFHRGKRQRKQQTAEERIYGVFAEDSGACAAGPSLLAVSLRLFVVRSAMLMALCDGGRLCMHARGRGPFWLMLATCGCPPL